MKYSALLIAAPLLILAACGGKGDDKLGEQAQESMENRADNAMANGSMSEAQGDAMKDAAKEKEERIDDSDVNADALSSNQKTAIINSN